MPTCALRNCKSRYGKKTPDISLFSFPPVSNYSIREKWIRFVQKERREDNWLPSTASKLCSKHFRIHDLYKGKSGRTVLKKGSVPYNMNEDVEINAESNRATPIDVYVSDSESIFDSPGKIALKTQVLKLQKLKIRHKDKIKKLGQQNRFLQRKLLKLRYFVTDLKKRVAIQKRLTNSLKTNAETQTCNHVQVGSASQECCIHRSL